MEAEDAARLQEKFHDQKVVIENLEKELTRLKHKEQLVNEYAGSMHDKLQQKDDVIATKERRIEFLEGEVLHLQDTLADAREAVRLAALSVHHNPGDVTAVTTGMRDGCGTPASAEDTPCSKDASAAVAQSMSQSIKEGHNTASSSSSSGGKTTGGLSMLARLRGCMPTLRAVSTPSRPRALPKYIHLYVGGVIAVLAVVAVVVKVVSQMGGGEEAGGGFGDEDGDMGF